MSRSYSNNSIKKRTLIFISSIMALLCFVFLGTGIFTNYRHAVSGIETDNVQAKLAYSDAINSMYIKYIKYAEDMAHDKAVIDSFYENDRAALMDAANARFLDIKNTDKYLKIIHFHTADNKSFLRVHDPAAHSDYLGNIRSMIADTNKNNDINTGLESGKYGAFFRISVPVNKGEEHIGALELGISPEFLSAQMEKMSGIATGILVDKRFLTNKPVSKNYEDFGNFGIISQRAGLFKEVLLDSVDINSSLNIKKIDNTFYSFSALNEVKSYTGSVVARIMVMHDITDEFYSFINTMGALVLIVFSIMALALVGINYSFEAIIKRLNSKEKKNRIRQMQDRLTLLPNRLQFIKDVDQRPDSTLIIINIDRFKDINNMYGLSAGDQVLKDYGLKLREYLNDFSERHYGFINFKRLYRLGRDEFVILLEHAPGLERALGEYVSNRTDSSVFVISDVEFTISVSIGISACNKKKLQAADKALKMSKSKKMKYCCYDGECGAVSVHENNIGIFSEVKAAVKEGRIVPYFQPILDNMTGEIRKYECLVRLVRPDGEVCSPGYFLPFIKSTRIYPEITKIMVEKSIQAFDGYDTEFSVNISAEDIQNREIIEFIKEQVGAMKNPERFILEILESENIENYEEVQKFISEMKQLGCKIAIDDFGTGYSNFQHLLKLDIDFLKIDGDIVKNTYSNELSRRVLETIVNFAQQLEVKTIAEFVCSEEVYETVKKAGLNYSQGYYISKPLSRPN